MSKHLCPECGQPIKSNASKFPRHYKCWLKTEEGKEYNRKKKAESRANLNPKKYPLPPKKYSDNPASIAQRERRKCKPNPRYVN